MEQQANDAGLEDVIEFVGQQSHQALQGYYDRIDILLMPSRSEGFGLTAIEGMARGCIVVAANIGGLPEVVIDKEVGLLHHPGDVHDIADKVNGLIDTPSELARMSRNAAGYVSTFSTERYNLLIKDLYTKLAQL
jgi:glycosyltransferase involved in cell wall biosynthesis